MHNGRVIVHFGLLICLVISATASDSVEPSGRLYNQTRYNNEVSDIYMSGLSSYHKVLSDLNDNLDQYLTNQSAPLEISEEMKQSIGDFLKKMTLADTNVKVLIKDVDVSSEQSTNNISEAESEITKTKGLIEEAKVRIAGAQKKIDLVTSKKQTLEANLKAHEEALRLAKERKDKARHECITGKRRKKRGLFKKIRNKVRKVHRKIRNKVRKVHGKVGQVHRKINSKLPGGKLVNKINKGIETGVCEAVNVVIGQIDKEKKAVDQAKAAVAQENAKLQSAKGELQTAQQDKARMEKSLEDHQEAIENYKVLIGEYKKARDMLIEVSLKLKEANTLISSIKTRAETVKFNTELGFLLDINGLITPLSEVADIVSKYSTEKTKDAYKIDTPTEKIEAMWRKLKEIAAKADE